MLDVSSKMNPGGSYDIAKPGDTSNRNYNPNYNGDPDFGLLYTSPSPRDKRQSRMPSSA